MSETVSLPERIQQLVRERKQHAGALARIDKTLGEINKLVGLPAAGAQSAAAAAKPQGQKRRKRRKYPITGEQSIIELIKQRGGASTSEIRKHWAADGRGGTADNVLTLMVNAKKLKRTPLKDQPGSKYTLP